MKKWNITAQGETEGFILNEMAEEVRITENGDIYFLDANEEIVRLIAKGNWTFVNLSNSPQKQDPDEKVKEIYGLGFMCYDCKKHLTVKEGELRWKDDIIEMVRCNSCMGTIFTAPEDGVYSFEGVKVGDLPIASQNQSLEKGDEE